MNLYHFRYWVDAVEAGSLTAAARKNQVSHSAVSLAIRSLETLFGGKLLHHKKRSFEPTDLGTQVHRELKTYLTSFDDLRERVKNFGEVPQGDLSVMAPQSLLVRELFSVLQSFRQAYPLIHLKVRTGDSRTVRREVNDRWVNLGILVDDGKAQSFDRHVLGKGRFVLVSRKAGTMLGERPLIYTQREKREVEYLFQQAKRKGLKVSEASMEAVSWTLIKELARQDYGHGYLPDYLVQHDLKRGKLHSVEGWGAPFRYEIVVIAHPERPLSRNAELLREHLRKKFRTETA